MIFETPVKVPDVSFAEIDQASVRFDQDEVIVNDRSVRDERDNGDTNSLMAKIYGGKNCWNSAGKHQ